MQDAWPNSGFRELRRDERRCLIPTDDHLRTYLRWPELALAGDSCPDEHRLHDDLLAAPRQPIGGDRLASLSDDDARHNYAHFLRFRDALLAAGTLEAWYLGVVRSGRVDIPPIFVDRVVEAIVHGIVDGCNDAFVWRAAELLFREQRVAVHEGRVLAADREAVDGTRASGRDMDVLVADNAHRYWPASDRHSFGLDLSHEIASDLGHGLRLTMAYRHSGQTALAWVLERWLLHLLGIAVAITPVARIDDDAWSWHVGLDAESMALLNALWRGSTSPAGGGDRMVGLFRLVFADESDMRADLAGKPVHLGLAMTQDGIIRLKPQNLLVNLPLAATPTPS